MSILVINISETLSFKNIFKHIFLFFIGIGQQCISRVAYRGNSAIKCILFSILSLQYLQIRPSAGFSVHLARLPHSFSRSCVAIRIFAITLFNLLLRQQLIDFSFVYLDFILVYVLSLFLLYHVYLMYLYCC